MDNVLMECKQCGADIKQRDIYFKDGEDNHFCSKDCATGYHEIVEIDFETEHGWHAYEGRRG